MFEMAVSMPVCVCGCIAEMHQLRECTLRWGQKPVCSHVQGITIRGAISHAKMIR